MNKINPQSPIGVFDSGIGGLTVAKALSQHLPNERLIYFGDIAHLPFGDKSDDAIRYYCIRIAQFLIEQGCKLIVIACNSASATAYDVLVKFFEGKMLFINVIDPLVQKVVEQDFQKVGVIATKVTVRSDVYRKKLLAAQHGLKVNSLAAPLLVPMIEEGFFENKISHHIIEAYLTDEKLQNIDALLLACTHYPLIKKEIEDFYEGKVQIYDSRDVVADAVKKMLQKHQLDHKNEQKGANEFYVSDFTQSFEETAKLFYGESVKMTHCPIWNE